MTKMNIIYLHGFGSDGSSSKGVELNSVFGKEFNVITPTLPVNPIEAVQFISGLLSNNGNCILVGTSLGGFYADYFNKIADIPCVLINPAIDITPIRSYIGTNVNYNSGETYEYTRKDFGDLIKLKDKKDSLGYSDSPEYIIVAKDDNLCDYRIAQQTFTSNTQWLQVLEKGGHRFDDMDKFIEVVTDLIEDIGDYDFSRVHNNQVYEFKKPVLNEKFLNLWNQTEKEKVFPKVKELIDFSYKYIGGIKGNVEDFLSDDYFWKLIRKNGNIVAGAIYKDKLGRKSVCIFTDGSYLGKIGIKTIIAEDIKLGRAWAEVSGKAELMFKHSLKANPLPHSMVKIVMDIIGKKVIDWDDDGYHYTRVIKGEPTTKAMFGTYK